MSSPFPPYVSAEAEDRTSAAKSSKVNFSRRVLPSKSVKKQLGISLRLRFFWTQSVHAPVRAG